MVTVPETISVFISVHIEFKWSRMFTALNWLYEYVCFVSDICLTMNIQVLFLIKNSEYYFQIFR
jgi:hypothetical protein